MRPTAGKKTEVLASKHPVFPAQCVAPCDRPIFAHAATDRSQAPDTSLSVPAGSAVEELNARLCSSDAAAPRGGPPAFPEAPGCSAVPAGMACPRTTIFLTPADVARRCKMSVKTVLRAIHSGSLRASRLGGRYAYRIRS